MRTQSVSLSILLIFLCLLAACGDDDPSTGSGQADNDDHAADDDASVDDDMICDDDSLADDDATPDGDDDSLADDDATPDDDDDTEDDDDDAIVAPTDVQVWAVGGSDQGVILHYADGEVTLEEIPAGIPSISKISMASAMHGLAATVKNLLVYDGESWQPDSQFSDLPENDYLRAILSTPIGDWVSVYSYDDYRPRVFRKTNAAWEATDTSALPEGAVEHLIYDGDRVWAVGHVDDPPALNYSLYYEPTTNQWMSHGVIFGLGINSYINSADFYNSTFAMAGGVITEPPLGQGSLFAFSGNNWRRVPLNSNYLPPKTESITAISIYGDQQAYVAGVATMAYFIYYCFLVKYDHGQWSPAGEVSYSGIVAQIRAMAEDEYWYVGYYLDDYGNNPIRAVFRYCLDHKCINLLAPGQMNALLAMNDLVVLPASE